LRPGDVPQARLRLRGRAQGRVPRRRALLRHGAHVDPAAGRRVGQPARLSISKEDNRAGCPTRHFVAYSTLNVTFSPGEPGAVTSTWPVRLSTVNSWKMRPNSDSLS